MREERSNRRQTNAGNKVPDKLPKKKESGGRTKMKLTYNELATIIEGMYYGGVDEDIESTEELIEYLNNNRDSSVVLMSSGSDE